MSKKIKVFTIGFTKSSAKSFFQRVQSSGATKMLDVRLNNTSQLAAFAKADDLAYFLKSLCHVEYVHNPLLAPTENILRDFKKNKGDWGVYQGLFLKLMQERQIENKIDPEFLRNSCLLCSEATPHHCHRRLVCEYLDNKWGNNLDIVHL